MRSDVLALGPPVDICVTQATGMAEQEAAAAMATNLPRSTTVEADKGHETGSAGRRRSPGRRVA